MTEGEQPQEHHQQRTPPIPLEAVREEFGRYLREQGVDPETVPFEVRHEDYFGRFDGEQRSITITVLTLPDGSSYRWFPELPDEQREQRRRQQEARR